jgi:hypothetical protein
MPWPKVLTFWLTDIRKAALIACVAMVLGVLIPAWDGARTMLAIESIGSWSIPLILLTYCVTAIMPVFFFALYRNEGLLDFPKSLRVLSLAAAIVLGVITVAGLPQWIETLRSYWADIRTLDWTAGAEAVSIVAGEPGTYTQVATLLGGFSNLAYIMLLIALFKQAGKETDGDIPNSRMLAIMTKIAVIAWGLIVAGCVVRLLFLPFVNSQIRDLAIQVGRTPPRLGTMMVDAVRTLLSQACLFTAPHVVYRSRLRRTEVA